ncbi:tetratricopeptide repeat protein [Prosthecobacter fusiformis]|uniref:Tetratricopeptide repeat protein n=1 Tax=Prosthecobacter fusiformis TaxID=48464 RepID=A0A4R7SQ70_9BACT|nr:tetratricopeptide repeat protein [Prosthecobacter fusiformis]TDU81380.1 tetratricopeptide repeat protein [Prosthecobacter fusiformis]
MSKATPPAPSPVPPAPIETSTPMEEFLEAHFKKLVLLFAVIAIGAVLYGVVSYTNRAAAVAAGEAFAAAKTVEDCDLVISEYPGSLAAGNALLLKSDLLWSQNKKDSSVEALRLFTTQHADHPLLAENLLGLATKLESMGEASQAQPVFERVINEFSSSDVAALAQLRLGDLLWAAGKEEEAKAAYEAVPAKFSNANSTFLEQSEGRMRWISAKLPTKEVDGPPKPKVETPAAVPGAPQLKLDSTTLNPTLAPAGAETQPQAAPAPGAPMIEVTPAPAAPAAPAAPRVEVTPAPAPAAPAMPAAEPAAPAPAPAPVEPVAPKIEVNPAPAAPAAPVPAPTPAPVPAPADPAPPAPAGTTPVKAS